MYDQLYPYFNEIFSKLLLTCTGRTSNVVCELGLQQPRFDEHSNSGTLTWQQPSFEQLMFVV